MLWQLVLISFLPAFQASAAQLSLLILALGLPWATWASVQELSAGRRRGTTLPLAEYRSEVSCEPPQADSEDYGWWEAREDRWRDHHLLGRHPAGFACSPHSQPIFLGRNWLFLLRLFPVQPARSGLAFGLQHFLRWWSLHIPHIQTRHRNQGCKEIYLFWRAVQHCLQDWRDIPITQPFHFWKSVLENCVQGDVYKENICNSTRVETTYSMQRDG